MTKSMIPNIPSTTLKNWRKVTTTTCKATPNRSHLAFAIPRQVGWPSNRTYFVCLCYLKRWAWSHLHNILSQSLILNLMCTVNCTLLGTWGTHKLASKTHNNNCTDWQRMQIQTISGSCSSLLHEHESFCLSSCAKTVNKLLTCNSA